MAHAFDPDHLRSGNGVGGSLAVPGWHEAVVGAVHNGRRHVQAGQGRPAVAVRPMIERGDLTEADVLAPTMFNDCDWADDFSMSNPAAAYARTNWHRIEQSGGIWGFTSAALNG